MRSEFKERTITHGLLRPGCFISMHVCNMASDVRLELTSLSENKRMKFPVAAASFLPNAYSAGCPGLPGGGQHRSDRPK
jgi:hypothetical protein